MRKSTGSASPTWDARLRNRIEELGWSVAELARRMGRGDDQSFIDRLYKYVAGKVTHPRGDMLEQIGQALGLSEKILRYGAGDEGIGFGFSDVAQIFDQPAHQVRTLGEVAANVWRAVDFADQAQFENDDLAEPPDPRFPAAAQYDLIIRGTSINRFAPDGYRLRVVDLQTAGLEVKEGELVVVRRTKDDGQLVETTAKRLKRSAAGLELWPESDDPRWQTPISLGNDPERETVEIIGLVIKAYRPARRA